MAQLVPGDVVQLAAGDMIPADVRLISCKDLFLTQASLTGESFPVEKFAVQEAAEEAIAAGIDRTSASWAPASRAARPRRSSWPPA